MREATCRRVRARTMRGRAGGTKALAIPLGESRGKENDVLRLNLLLVALLAGQRFGTDDVVGLDPSGRADSETGFAREASSRAVLLSPRRKAACAEARPASSKSPFRP